MESGQAPVLQTMHAISQREKCLQAIHVFNKELAAALELKPAKEALDELIDAAEAKIRELRALTINAVSFISYWREQFPGQPVPKPKRKGGKKKQTRQPDPVPYLTSEHVNYLVKMQTDTNAFCSLPMGKFFNFGAENSRGDPMLVKTSIVSVLATHGKGSYLGRDKRILEFDAEEEDKARVAEEIIFAEKAFSGELPTDQPRLG